jgi:predicted GH43/DUF377 family glycosyl hydrolase
MKWNKKGMIYTPNGEFPWAKSNAMVPTPDLISTEIIRLYIASCDENGIGRVGYIDVKGNDPSKIIQISEKPVLDIGEAGTFDENGILPCSIVKLPDGQKYLYFVGFELGTKIRYRLLSGLAISNDGGNSFEKLHKTPVLERSDHELLFRCGPFVLFDEGKFKLWYVAGSTWILIDKVYKPVYTINYLESSDGIHWGDAGQLCIEVSRNEEHGFGRPYILKESGFYRMFYSIRIKHKDYRLGYAESEDGIHWVRKDAEIGIDISEDGWDSKMICYSAVIKVKDKVYMFYNGNDFGKSGVGYAVLESW